MSQVYHVQYCDPHSIIIVNVSGRMRVLYTPFKVISIIEVGNLRANTMVYVDEVGTTHKDELVYYVAGAAYYHHVFRILARF